MQHKYNVLQYSVNSVQMLPHKIASSGITLNNASD